MKVFVTVWTRTGAQQKMAFSSYCPDCRARRRPPSAVTVRTARRVERRGEESRSSSSRYCPDGNWSDEEKKAEAQVLVTVRTGTGAQLKIAFRYKNCRTSGTSAWRLRTCAPSAHEELVWSTIGEWRLRTCSSSRKTATKTAAQVALARALISIL